MDWLIAKFATAQDNVAFIHEGQAVNYGNVITKTEHFTHILQAQNIRPGQIVSVIGDYSPDVFCLILALALNRNVIIPLTRESVIEQDTALQISGCDWLMEFDLNNTEVAISTHHIPCGSALLTDFVDQNIGAGLILFSSGSTGKTQGDFT